MVVFEDGLPRKDEYRRFTIPPASTDDTDSIHQVLTRRLAYLRDPETADASAETSGAETSRSGGAPSAVTSEHDVDVAPATQEVHLPAEPPPHRRRPAAGRGGRAGAARVGRSGHRDLRYREAA